MNSTAEERRKLETLDRAALAQYQLARLSALFDQILPNNAFYAAKLANFGFPLTSPADFSRLPFTTKDELLSRSSTSDFAANLTYPRELYARFHQTSGTHGRPMIVLDTHQDWPWWMHCWQFILDAAKIERGDCVFLAFSFGPFIGFWSAYEAAAQRGCLVVPGGGLNTRARLDLIRRSQATAIFCTPSYALHMAEVAAQQQINVAALGIKSLVLAGEPGGSLPAVRSRLQQTWQANVIDHAGASEVGPWGYGYAEGGGIHVLETEFIAEFIACGTGQPAGEGELAELVLTNLGRMGCPVIRYRTGDIVRPTWQHSSANRFVFLEGGVLSRGDDMLVLRGVNVFPSAIEQVVRGFPEVAEYRAIVHTVAAMDQLTIEIEDALHQPQRVADELQLRLGLKIDVRLVPNGSLPRFEGKGRRWNDQRGKNQ